MKRPIPLFCFLLLLACQHPAPPVVTASLPSLPSPQDTGSNGSVAFEKTHADSMEIESLTLKEVVKMFDDTVMVDTVIYRGSDTIAFSFKNYADKSKTITIPEHYMRSWGLNSYAAPVFISTVHLSNNGLHLLDTTYDHRIFDNMVYPEWKGLVVLFGPVVKFEKKYIGLSYSLFIPLTDVGVPATVKIDYNGALMPQEL